MFGKHHTEEHRRRISRLLKGDPRLGYWKGKKMSQETREKMRLSHTGSKNHFYGKKHAPATLRMIGLKHRRENLSQETLNKMRLAALGRQGSEKQKEAARAFNKKRVYKPHSLESRKKNSDAHKGKKPWNHGVPNPAFRGANNPRWKGGITSENMRIRSSLKYVTWRRKVFARDGYMCILGGKAHGSRLEADHIKTFSEFPKLRFRLNNGRTLCRDCHKKTETYGNRKRV